MRKEEVAPILKEWLPVYLGQDSGTEEENMAKEDDY